MTSGAPPTLAGAAILALAYLKARLILNRYLGLDSAPFWKRGFELVIALWMLLLLLLYLAPNLRVALRF